MAFARPLPLKFLPLQISEINPDLIPKLANCADIQYVNDCTRFLPSRGQSAIISNKEILTSPQAVKTVFLFTLIADCLNECQPGDSFEIFCKNDTEIVSELIDRLGYNPDQRIIISGNMHFCNQVITILELFSEFLDISAYPKKSFLRHLSEYCDDPSDRQALIFLSSRPGSSAYLELVKEYACLSDFLLTFPSCKPPLECILAHLSPLSPRSYSVMSNRGNGIEFIISIDKYITPQPNERTRFGVCSKYLQDKCHLRSSVFISLKSSSFRQPIDSSDPLIMICAGTGVSPFIGFLRHREGFSNISWLFFGLRSKDNDFLFKEELQEYEKSNPLFKLFISTSRESPKQYIQDVLIEQSESLKDLLMQPSTKIYLCGDEMKMIKGVNEALLNIVSNALGSMDAGKVEIKKWNDAKKIMRDIWV